VPKGRSAANLVAGVAMRDFRLARRDGFCADLTSEIFQADLAVAMHENDERARVLIFHDQGFDDSMLIDAKLA